MKALYKLSGLLAGFVLAVAAGTTGAGLAVADGYQRAAKPAPVMEAPTSWSGVYFGVHSGWAWSSIDSTFPSGSSFSVDSSPMVVGGHIGVQHQMGQLVLGVEGSFTSALRDTWDSQVCPNPSADCAGRFDDVISVGPRLGWDMGKFMPYLTAGYASVAIAQRFTNSAGAAVAPLGFIADSRERHDGWYIGGGLDWVAAPNWIVGIEYRHYELDDAFHAFHCTGAVTTGPNTCLQFAGAITNSTVTEPTLDTVTVRVSWKFGRPETVVPLK